MKPRQVEVMGVHARCEDAFDDELPEYFLRQKQKRTAALLPDILHVGRESIAGGVKLTP
jgi:hypothetical protein